jgi:hypothetical protein
MFSQRNNPYCDLVSKNVMAKINKFFDIYTLYVKSFKYIYSQILNIIKHMKRILGLDLGTNSIGWTLVEQNLDEKQGKILGMGSRIKNKSHGVRGIKKIFGL